MVGGGRPILGEILGQRVRVLCCSLCFSAQFLVHSFVTAAIADYG